MARKILPSEAIAKQIDDLMASSWGSSQELLTELGSLGARLVIQRAVEKEADAFLGRVLHERSSGEFTGHRNGWRDRVVHTGEGTLAIKTPKFREVAMPFISTVVPRGKRILRTAPLEALVIGGFVRGLSTRDVEDLFDEVTGMGVSRSEVSRICDKLKERYTAFRERDLSDIRLASLFLDAIFLPVRATGEKEGVLVAWGITENGDRILLEVMLGSRESYDAWHCLTRSLTDRGLEMPLLIVTDGAKGLIRAVQETWPQSLRQRCTVHKLRNVHAKLPDRAHQDVKAKYWHVLDNAANEAEAIDGLEMLARSLTRAGYDAAATCLQEDLPALASHLKLPPRHRKRWRSTNLLERSLGEVARRAKVIGRFPGESSCLTISWAVLDLTITNQNRVNITHLDQQHLTRLRHKRQPADTNNGHAAA